MTKEDRVGDAMLKYLHNRSDIEIISFHPTSGKAYQTDTIRFKVQRNGTATSTRYHVDMILVVGDLLLLIEFKGTSAESTNDVTKLRDLRETYSLQEFIRIISRRLSLSNSSIGQVTELVLAIGVEDHNAHVPDDVAVFVALDEHVTLECSPSLRSRLSPYFGDIMPAF